MRTIYKYVMSEPWSVFNMPKGAKILSVQLQRKYPVILAMVDTGKQIEMRTFATFDTGQDIDLISPTKYIGTVQENGGIVSHIFEVLKG